MILGWSKFDSSTQALKELHILPVRVRCEYKLLVLVFKCLHNLAPKYLSDLLTVKVSKYNTRSSCNYNLFVPAPKNNSFADRSFSVAGPKMWNGLPESIKASLTVDVFKQRLKTHLFARYFNS